MLMNIVDRGTVREIHLQTAYFLPGFIAAVVYSPIRKEYAPGAIIARTWYPLLIICARSWVDFRGTRRDVVKHRYHLGTAI